VTARRELWLAVLLCLAGSALALFAVTRTWVTFTDPQQLTIHDVARPERGVHYAPEIRALGVVGLAGVVAVAATRSWGRILVGVLLSLAGGVIVLRVGDLLAGRVATGPSAHTHLVWPWLALLGGLVMAAGGSVVAARGRRWAALSSSYETPAARESAPEPTDKGTWDALDRGDDPTA
jgi:uncharacterized membrane protein (TIGR02234 family)